MITTSVLVIVLLFLLFFWYTVAYVIQSRRKRNLCLAVIVDNDLLTSPSWNIAKKRIENALKDATVTFKENFGIQFTLSRTLVFSFSRPLACPSIDVNQCFEDIITQKNIFDEDVLLAITDKALHGFKLAGNMEIPFKDAAGAGSTSGVMIVSLTDDEIYDHSLWCHELAHIFGAKHSPDQASVMYYCRTNPPSIHFDKDNQKIIYKNKFRQFSKKFP